MPIITIKKRINPPFLLNLNGFTPLPSGEMSAPQSANLGNFADFVVFGAFPAYAVIRSFLTLKSGKH